MADSSKTREFTDYSIDIDRLGCTPIWGFKQDIFSFDNLWDGYLIRRIIQCMSISNIDDLSDKLLMELEIPDNSVTTGLSYNSDDCCVIFPHIKKEYVKALYKVSKSEFISDSIIHDGQMVVEPITILCDNPALNFKLDTGWWNSHSIWYEGDDIPKFVGRSYPGNCSYCNRGTSFIYRNKYFCSLPCLTELRLKVVRICK